MDAHYRRAMAGSRGPLTHTQIWPGRSVRLYQTLNVPQAREEPMTAGIEGIKRLSAQFDPLSDGYIADPYPHMSEARDLAPVFYSEKLDHWVVTRYHLIRQVFLD